MEGALSVIALVTVVVSTGAITVTAHFRKGRTDELRTWARARGWAYTESHPRPLEDTVLPRGTHGPRARSQHVLTGRHGRHEVTFFEYSHTLPTTTRRGAGRTRHTYRIVAVRLPKAGPDLEIHRRAPVGGVTGEDPESAFAEAFTTNGSDNEFTRAALDRPLTSWLLTDPRAHSLPVRFSGSYVLTWVAMRLDPDRALTAADYLIDLLERVPAEAWKRSTTP